MNKQDVYAILNRAYFSEDCHEKVLLSQLPRFLEKARLVVDVGASLGQYTRCASEAMEGGRIVAVEADPIRHEELRRNAALWAQKSAVTIDCLFAAISNQVGSVTFHTTNSNVSGGLFPHKVKQDVQWQEIEVPATTLDTLFPNETPDFVKADIEGAELRMLQGATRILGERKTIFLLEMHPWADPDSGMPNATVTSFMRSYGYWPVSFYEHTLFIPLGWLYLREKLAAGMRKYFRFGR